MINFKNNRFNAWIFSGFFFLSVFFYFLFLDRYHLQYLEQNQLFRFNWNYLNEFLLKPGGFLEITGAFLTQFFLFPWLGAVIITLLGISFFLLTRSIFRKHHLNGVLFSAFPIMFLTALHSYHAFKFSYSAGILFVILLYAVYVNFKRSSFRYAFGILSAVLSYFLLGGFFIILLVLYIVHATLFSRESFRFWAAAIFASIALIVPYLGWRFIYFVPFNSAWNFEIPFDLPFIYLLLLGIWMAYTPLVLSGIYLTLILAKKDSIYFGWNLRDLSVGLIIFILFGYGLFHYAYDRKNEAFLKIDYYVQQSQWEKVLQLSRTYPSTNQIVVYYTNLALYKTGQLSNSMFNYRQAGPNGLWLEWKRDEIAPFYGGEVFYHLAYNNEAYRWAFEAMEAKGMNPRSLKRLAITSLVNYNYPLAMKFLHFLDQSLFYRNWALHYEKDIADTSLILQDQELIDKRYFLPHSDFISDINTKDMGLGQLLYNHPDNRMAFEYLMASFLLNKNLKAFAENIYRLKELGYTEIPIHFEEALLLYMGMTKQDIVPVGYSINALTRQRFHDYATLFASYRNTPELAAKVLFDQFGGTYWFYMQFENNSKK